MHTGSPGLSESPQLRRPRLSSFRGLILPSARRALLSLAETPWPSKRSNGLNPYPIQHPIELVHLLGNPKITLRLRLLRNWHTLTSHCTRTAVSRPIFTVANRTANIVDPVIVPYRQIVCSRDGKKNFIDYGYFLQFLFISGKSINIFLGFFFQSCLFMID